MRGILAVALCALSLLLPAPAYAASGDPAPNWHTISTGYGEVAAAVSQSGRVFTVEHDTPGENNYLELNSSYNGSWPTPTTVPDALGRVGAGPGAYAIVLSQSQTGDLLAREFVANTWTDSITVATGIRGFTWDTNADGDAVVVWRTETGYVLGLHDRGGTWSTVPVPFTPTGAFDVVINEVGKVTLVWVEGDSRLLRRSVLRPAETTWTSPQSYGPVSTDYPIIVTDGAGVETVMAGVRLWRQRTTNTSLAFAFDVGPGATVASGNAYTRVIWPYRNGRYLSVRTRLYKTSWSPTTTVWAKTFPTSVSAACLQWVVTGLAVAPAGRSYVALGVYAGYECDYRPARLVTVDGLNHVVNDVGFGAFQTGSGFGVDASVRGPIVVTYMSDGADNGWGGSRYVTFFSR